MTETQVIAKFRKTVGKDGVVYKLHGNQFQASLPDVLWIHHDITTCLEFKVVDGTTLPWSKCRLDQHLRLLEIRKHTRYAYYAVYSKKTDTLVFLNPEFVKEGFSCDLSSGYVVTLV